MRKIILLFLSGIGVYDSAYLTIEHYKNTLPPCSIHAFASDCGKVLHSQYAVVFGIPLAVFGIVFYGSIFLTLLFCFRFKTHFLRKVILTITPIRFLFSLCLFYVLLFVIHAICLYCLVSAVTSTLLFLLSYIFFKVIKKENKRITS